MKLTYEERLLVVEDHKGYGTAYTSRKRGLSERYVKTIVSKARNNSLSLNNKHTNYSAEFKIKVEMFYGKEKTFKDLNDLETAIKDYINCYNSDRVCKRLKGLSPINFRKQALNSVSMT